MYIIGTEKFPKKVLNRQDLEFLAATTFAVLDFCLFSSDSLDFSRSDDPAGDKDYLLEYLYKYDYRGNVVSEILDHVMTEEGTHLCSITEYNIVYYE